MNDEKDKAAALLDTKRGGDRLRDIAKKHRDGLTDREREILDTRFNTNEPPKPRLCHFCEGPIEESRPNCYACGSCDQC